MLKRININTTKTKEVIDLTQKLNELLEDLNKDEGVLTVFVTHTTAGLTTGEMGEGTDEDLLEVMEELIPKISFRHAHDPLHAWTHMASSIIGACLSIPFENKRLILGTWQSVLLVEFDGPRERTVTVYSS